MITKWVADIGEAVSVVIGEERLREESDVWLRHARRTSLVVVVHGPVDAGKSTLIHRLLVEDGTTIPDWLLVSGRRETLGVSSVESCGITYVDTPGTAGGTLEHDELAASAVRTADVVLLMIPPQLVEEDAAWIRTFTSGTLFSDVPRSLFPAGSLLLAIGRADEAGRDPRDDPAGFHDLTERKRRELLAMLRLAEHESHPVVHAVAADPDGQVSGDPDARAEDFAGNDWDGVAALRNDLGSLRERLGELRVASRVRFWCQLATSAAIAADAELATLRPVLAEAHSRQKRRAGLRQRLTALHSAASAELRVALLNELNGLANRTGLSEEDLRTQAESRLTECLNAWYETYTRKLEQLAAEIDAELAVERVRPASVRFDAWLRDLAGARKESKERSSAGPDLTKLSEGVNLAARGVFWLRHRVSMETAREELAKISQMEKAAKTTAEAAGKAKSYFEEPGRLFPNQEAVEKVARWLPKVDKAVQVADIALEFGPLAVSAIREHRDGIKEAMRRKKLRAQITSLVDDLHDRLIGDESDHGWSAAVASVRSHIEADPLLAPVATAAAERIEKLTSARRRLRELVERLPTAESG